METQKRHLIIKRTSDDTNETPKEDRKYRMFPKGGYVATLSDWTNYAQDSKFDGLKIIEKDGSVEYRNLTKKRRTYV